MIKLQAKEGYILHDKVNDEYMEVIYIPDTEMDNFEEITLSEMKMNELQRQINERDLLIIELATEIAKLKLTL